MEEGAKVLIVGAGPTGLAMAIMLRRQGISCRVVDKEGQPPLTSRALAIQARTLEMFGDLGVVEPFLEAGNRVQYLNAYLGSHRVARLDFGGLDSPYPFVLMLAQNVTEELLSQRLNREGVGIERDLELVDIRDRGKTVEVTLKDATGAEQELEYDWVVGCDGGHSKVREQLGISFEGTDDPEKFVMGDVRVSSEIDLNEVHGFLAEKGVALVIPQGHQLCRLIFHLPEVAPGAERYQPTLAELQALAHERIPFEFHCNELVWSSHFYTHHRIAGTFRKNRVMLVGDAAHVHSPAGGQGMNTGLQDAYNLAWKLGWVIQGRADAMLLDTYDQERRDVATALLRFTDRLTKLVTTREAIPRLVRTVGAPLIGMTHLGNGPLTRRISQLAVHHRKASRAWERSYPLWQSGLSGEARAFRRGPHAGDRLPDCPIEVAGTSETRSLFDLLKGFGYRLLLFPGTKMDDLEAERLLNLAHWAQEEWKEGLQVFLVTDEKGVLPANRWPASVIVDKKRQLRKKLGAMGSATILVRPDNVVALRCPCIDDDWVKRYFQTLR